VPAFGLPDRCSAQQAPSSRLDIVRLPIIEGQGIRFRKLSNPQNLSHVRVQSIVQDAQEFVWFVRGIQIPSKLLRESGNRSW